MGPGPRLTGGIVLARAPINSLRGVSSPTGPAQRIAASKLSIDTNENATELSATP